MVHTTADHIGRHATTTHSLPPPYIRSFLPPYLASFFPHFCGRLQRVSLTDIDCVYLTVLRIPPPPPPPPPLSVVLLQPRMVRMPCLVLCVLVCLALLCRVALGQVVTTGRLTFISAHSERQLVAALGTAMSSSTTSGSLSLSSTAPASPGRAECSFCRDRETGTTSRDQTTVSPASQPASQHADRGVAWQRSIAA